MLQLELLWGKQLPCFSLSLPDSLSHSVCLTLSVFPLWISWIEQLWPNHTRTGAEVVFHVQSAVLIISVDKTYGARGSSAAAPRCLCLALLSGQRYVRLDGATPKNSPGACEWEDVWGKQKESKGNTLITAFTESGAKGLKKSGGRGGGGVQ